MEQKASKSFTPATLEEALRDKKVGPRKLTFEQYKARQKKAEVQPVVAEPKQKRPRGGKRVHLKKQRVNAFRIAAVAVTSKEKQYFLNQAENYKQQLKREYGKNSIQRSNGHQQCSNCQH